jgi:hypothetical protein
MEEECSKKVFFLPMDVAAIQQIPIKYIRQSDFGLGIMTESAYFLSSRCT